MIGLFERGIKHYVQRVANNFLDGAAMLKDDVAGALEPEWLHIVIGMARRVGEAFYPYFTLGGLHVRPTGEVLNGEGQMIPGLYAAGRTSCGLPRTAAGYGSGMSVGDATYFGRVAGKHVAARES